MNEFLKLANNPFKFRMYLLVKLPAAFFSGIKVKECSEDTCITSVPYKWLTQNPFKSTYFASLAMAAEMSTGALALSNIYKRNPSVASLVTKMKVEYFKKATGITYFTCNDGRFIKRTIEEAITTDSPKTVTVKSVGHNNGGETVAEFEFTWSFKARK